MENNFNNLEIDNIKDTNEIESPNKHQKYISFSNKNELNNIDYDKNITIKNKNSKYIVNKFNNMEKNNIDETSIKNNTSIQEKLKKIFMNRDKLKFQYTKHDIPENLKYNSDDSESSDISALRKSKISKKNNFNNNNSNNKLYTYRENQQSSKKHKMSIGSNISNSNNKRKQSDLKDEIPFSHKPIQAFDEKEKNLSNNRKFVEEEKTKSDEINENCIFQCNNNNWNDKDIEEEKEQTQNDENKKENTKKNALLKMFEKKDKENIENEINNKKDNDFYCDKKIRNQKEENIQKDKEDENKERKQKLLKLLFNKKENNEIENNEIENENEIVEENLKNKNDIEKEKDNRRRKIIEELKTESSNSPSKNYKKESIEKTKEILNKEEKDEKGKNDNDKGTYIPNKHKNKLTINIKPKIENNINLEEKNEKIDKKSNVLLNILDKLKKKKSEEQNIPKNVINKEKINSNIDDDIDINESEIEREAEKIRKKEKKLEEKKKAKENLKKIQKKEKQEKIIINKDINNENNDYNDIELKKEEKRRRKKLEEDLRAEINSSINKEDLSIVNDSSKSNIVSNNQPYELKTKAKNKDIINNKKIPTLNGTKEIIINDIPKGNLDRSFDGYNNAYTKRKIPNRKTALNIYKPKKPDIRKRSTEKNINELLENNPNSFNPNQNINSDLPYNYQPNKLTYIKKKSSFNDFSNFIKNNQSFCEYANDNSNDNRKNIDMEIEIGTALNSSFDAYMQMTNTNFYNNNLCLNTAREPYYETSVKNIRNGNYSKVTHIQPNRLNLNGNMNCGNNNYNNKSTANYNKDVNRSFGYINNFNNNNIFENNNKDIKPKTSIISKLNNNQRHKFITYNNNNQNSNFCKSPLKNYINQSNLTRENKFTKTFYPNSPTKKRYDSVLQNENTNTTNNDTFYQNTERNASINIEDLMVLEEKFSDIIIALNRNQVMHHECFEFWNYYYNCSLYGKLEKLFKNENDSTNIQICINHILISVMICYDFSFEMHLLNNEYSILVDILELNNRNLIIIYEHILSKISSESKSNPWVYKLLNLVNNFNKIDNSNYISVNGKQLSSVEKIIYNYGIIVQNIRVLLKNYKTKRIEYLTSIFKKINEKTYEEINSFFRDNILRVDNVKGSVLASVFLKDNECFTTEPAPYIKTKNRKKFSLILDLDETLIHFKVNNEDDTEGVLQIRPGAIPFLEEMGKYYELIVFTAATQDYGDLLIDAIEENNLYFEHRFYRQHTVIIGNDFIKDLNRIGRPIDKMIIVDNMPQNFRFQKENGIHIKAFWGDDSSDNALEELGKILINIAKDGGDVRIGLKKYRDEIVNKVTSNISKSNY